MPAFDEQDYTKSFQWGIWKRLMPVMRPYRRDFAGMFAFNLITAAIDVVLPLFQRYAISNYIEAGTLSGLLPYTLCYFGVILLQALSVVAFARNSMKIEMCAGRDMRANLFTHLQTLSFSFYNVTPVGYLLSRVMSDTSRIASMVAWNLTDILWAMFYVLGTFAAMLLLNWKLALVVIVIVPVIAVLTGYFQNRILHWNRRVRKLNSRITGAFNEGIMGAMTTKTLVREEASAAEFRELTGAMRTASIRSALLSALFMPLVMALGSICTALALSRGGSLVFAGAMGFGTLAAFISYTTQLFDPIQQLARILAEMQSAQASAERVIDLLDTQPDIVDSPEVEAEYGTAFAPRRGNWPPIAGGVEFRDVTFAYKTGETVLRDFNLKVEPGQTIALVGETGAGKSTIVNLVCRFYEPTAGQVLIDGVDYRERSQLWLHSALGYVLQTPHLFSGSIADNIRYGRKDATLDEVKRAAAMVRADRFIEALPDGYGTEVGEGGGRLSTGQKQLVCFARVVLSDPRIFVLDEATSSIDTETEQLIQNAIQTVLTGRTSFIVAHRLSTIRSADKILVIRGGRITEAGTHDELLALGAPRPILPTGKGGNLK